MLPSLKSARRHLPARFESGLKKLRYRRQIERRTFTTPEPEYPMLAKFVSEGDWVLDVGANVGHYTVRLSELVGPQGRVLAFEPIPETFATLTSNLRSVPADNVSLINAAVSDRHELLSMSIPTFDNGATNYYRASIGSEHNAAIPVISLAIDDLDLADRVTFVKIDVEGHERAVIDGMHNLIRRDRPILVLETEDLALIEELDRFGYTSERLPESPNVIFLPQ